ncbi:MAG: DUF3422 domain-containing protein [Pseudomonadota bacterium]
MIELPDNHPQRFALTNEVHARPPEPVYRPATISCIALLASGPYRDEDRDSVIALTTQFGATPPGPGVKHYSVDLGDFRLIWERHTEFIRYTFIAPSSGEPFSNPAIERVPQAWLKALPGALIMGAHLELQDRPPDGPEAPIDFAAVSKAHFGGHALIGSDVANGKATAVTDFRVHKDGFSRFHVFDGGMTPWQAGQTVQRLLEIETYRIMALLALPLAQDLVPNLSKWEHDLAAIASRMTNEEDTDEPDLLERLTGLQASIEKSYTDSQFRFSAAAAYYALVRRRIEELRESRLAPVQTFHEFTERRLAPAMATCNSVERRQAALSERVDRSAQLLSTRVDLSLERQNQAVLESMNQRVELQLRLQQTVEGLSIAAITYYVVGVVGYVAKGLIAAGASLNVDLVMGASVPIVLAIAGYGVWHTRNELAKHQNSSEK